MAVDPVRRTDGERAHAAEAARDGSDGPHRRRWSARRGLLAALPLVLFTALASWFFLPLASGMSAADLVALKGKIQQKAAISRYQACFDREPITVDWVAGKVRVVGTAAGTRDLDLSGSEERAVQFTGACIIEVS